jgi:hypothetical protein
MNCYYCGKEMREVEKDRVYGCDRSEICPPMIFYAFSKSGKVLNHRFRIKDDKFDPDITDMVFYHKTGKFKLFELRRTAMALERLEPILMLTLDHHPDINPLNAEEWLTKLLNMRVFS